MNIENVELVLHAGDYISPFVVSHFKVSKARLIGVFGNNDAELERLNKLFTEAGNRVKGRFTEIKIDDKRVALLHGDEEELLKSLVNCGYYDVIVYGHTHRPVVRKEGETLIINPGEVCGYLTGKSTIATLDTETMKAEIVFL